VLLAYQPPAAIEKLGSALPRFTSRTIGSTAALAREFSRIREVGYAINRGEWRDGVCGLAAPIRDGSGTVIAAIGISGPADRLKARRLKDLAPSVVEAAWTISRSLGAPIERSAESQKSARQEHQRANHAAIVGY
jgi:DNA-binding IclR family transcriptional regulator